MTTIKHIPLVTLLILTIMCTTIESAPFFDAIYDAINGNGRRTYGYSGYGNGYTGYGSSGYGASGYGASGYGYNGYGYRPAAKPQRQGKTFKEICRVHFPDSVANPGAGGIVCPY